MKKILVLTTTFPLDKEDAQPRFVEYLCKKLAMNHKVIVLAPTISGNKGKLDAGAGFDVFRYRYFFSRYETLCGGDGILENLKRSKWLSLLIPFMVFFQLCQAVRICRTKNIDVIHAHWILPQGLVAVMASLISGRKIKVLITSHGGDLFALNGWLASRLKVYVLKNADHISVVSSAMKCLCTEGYGLSASQISVLPMGVDLKGTFVPSGDKISNKLVFVGRLAEKKGLDVLIHALALLKNQSSHYSLDVVGGGTQLEYYKSLVRNMCLENYIQFHGAMSNDSVVGFLQRAKIAVFPFKVASDGDQEGLGLTMVEAMGCGCVVIASNLPAVADVLEDNTNGLLVESNNPTKLSERIIYVGSEECNVEELVANARRSSFKKFDWSSIGDEYSELINGL